MLWIESERVSSTLLGKEGCGENGYEDDDYDTTRRTTTTTTTTTISTAQVETLVAAMELLYPDVIMHFASHDTGDIYL